jgi:hypothetical protein
MRGDFASDFTPCGMKPITLTIALEELDKWDVSCRLGLLDYPEDVKRIVQRFAEEGLLCEPAQAAVLWQYASESIYCATWMTVSEDVTRVLRPFFQVHDDVSH